ncbi:MAG: SAV_2336 N-terminal domain-related protein [Leptolyngbyaceae cyanobacterium]
METSEQQRRPTIGQSARELKRLGLEFDAVDLADMLWLAQHIELEAAAQADDEPTPAPVTPAVRTVDEGSTTSSDPVANLYVDDPGDTQTSTTTVEDEEDEADEPQGTPFPVPAAPAIRTRLDLARSLRPLMRKVPSRLRQELDEEATVTQIAETGLWVPVVKPQAERWLELDLVVEDSKTTFIWERVIAELQHLVEYQGAFRAIRTWRLAVPDLQTATAADIKLFPRWHETPENRAYQRPRSPRELIDPRSRRLVWVVTDCTSLLWRRGLIHDTLWAWAETQPVSLVQMFPERLWTRTALRDGHIVRLGATGPGLPSARLEVEGLPALDDWDDDDLDDESLEADLGATANRTAAVMEQRQLVLPVVTLDPQAMQRWARVMAGSGDGFTPGRVFELKTIRQMAKEYQTWSTQTQAKPRTARQRLALFRSGASDIAQQLVEYLAATPVSLPVIDLLRDEFVPKARQEHVAEVLLSGLLQRQDEPEDVGLCRYEFYADPKTDAEAAPPREKVRELLLDSVPVSRSSEVLDRLSQLIKDRAGNTLKSFEAFLKAYAAAGEALGEGALPLAEVGLSVLQRLGGSHAALAQRYAAVSSPSVPARPPPPLSTPPFRYRMWNTKWRNI